MNEVFGHWLPHTSSIDFCEPDYLLSHYVAEPFNVVSSLFIAVLGLCGLLHSNPTGEGMFTLQFVVIVAIGLGSVLLHTTLQAFPQSLDEVPMMWFNVLSYYIIMNMQAKRNAQNTWSIDALGVLFLSVAVLETYIYYSMRWLYVMFLLVYGSTLLGVTGWSAKYTFGKNITHSPAHVKLAKEIFIAACVSYFLVGGVCWIVDMNLCTHLLPLYTSCYGATLHIIWHVTAGYGGYLQTLLLVVARAGELGIAVERRWAWGVVPIIIRTTAEKRK
jgi:dihydroceramidase